MRSVTRRKNGATLEWSLQSASHVLMKAVLPISHVTKMYMNSTAIKVTGNHGIRRRRDAVVNRSKMPQATTTSATQLLSMEGKPTGTAHQLQSRARAEDLFKEHR